MSMLGCYVTWKSVTAQSLSKRTTNLVSAAQAIYNDVAGAASPQTENVALRLSLFEASYNTERESLTFFKSVAQDKSLRDASTDADRIFSELEVELSMHVGVFNQFVSLAASKDHKRSPELQRYIEKKVKLGRLAGLHLSTDIQEKIKVLAKEEKQLGVDFSSALVEENTIIEFTPEELDGVPESLLSSLKKTSDGKLEMTLKYPHYFPCMDHAKKPDTRRKLEHSFNRRCMDTNGPIVSRIMALRKERAALLGFKTHADYALTLCMSKTAANVNTFLLSLGEKLLPLRERDMKRLLQLKDEECKCLGLPNSGKIEPWDMRYYMNMVKKLDFVVDHEALRKYFPLSVVKKGILRIYQHLLGLRFKELVTDDVWHAEVDMLSVHDAKTDELMGYVYLDLHPRDGKFSHAACFSMQSNCLRPIPAEGKGDEFQALASCPPNGHIRQPAVCAMVANFTAPPASGGEAFFTHDEVETFFHEFGHVMHHICAHADTAMMSGLSVERDFVECPSQMLENWVWSKEGLAELIKGSTPIPDNLLTQLLSSRMANAGMFYCRQAILALFDQSIHTEAQTDYLTTYRELSKKYLGIEPSKGTNMIASFAHIIEGYDAQYYSYLWSEVFSADMYQSRFASAKDGGCLSPTVGMEYRIKILQPGSSKDADVLLRDFLGRDPEQAPFLRLLGL